MILVVHGTPVGKGRPRFVRATGRTYTPDQTVSAENAIRDVWINTGRTRCADGPLEIIVTLWLNRPQGHYKRDGTLSAAGQRSPRPTKRPDLDNSLKLCCDALNGLAYRDDAQITDATVHKLWCYPNETPRTVIELYPADDGQSTRAEMILRGVPDVQWRAEPDQPELEAAA